MACKNTSLRNTAFPPRTGLRSWLSCVLECCASNPGYRNLALSGVCEQASSASNLTRPIRPVRIDSVAGLQYSTVISPNDQMWISGPQWYFDVGTSALDSLKCALATAHIAPTSILDLPSGHGRVCRMLRAAFPEARLTACDLDRDAVDFCAAQFNTTGVYSHEDIRCVRLDQSFDLIWCGSLFTHLDREQWPDFLGFFADHLSPDGVSSSPPMDGSRSSGCEKVF